jgi:hypothetical protein
VDISQDPEKSKDKFQEKDLETSDESDERTPPTKDKDARGVDDSTVSSILSALGGAIDTTETKAG